MIEVKGRIQGHLKNFLWLCVIIYSFPQGSRACSACCGCHPLLFSERIKPASAAPPLITSLLASLLLFLWVVASVFLSSADFYSWEGDTVISGGAIEVHSKSFGFFSFFFCRMCVMVKQVWLSVTFPGPRCTLGLLTVYGDVCLSGQDRHLYNCLIQLPCFIFCLFWFIFCFI